MSGKALSASNINIYDAVTAQIVAAIEAGADLCVMPWHNGLMPMHMPRNAFTKEPYRGINIVALWAQSVTRLYACDYWASYGQWQKLGAQVRKGERGSLIIFYKKLEQDEDEQDTDDAEHAPKAVLRYSHVFNFDQVDGWELPLPEPRSEISTNEQLAAFVAATKADIRHGYTSASYRPEGDFIAMPSPGQFMATRTRSATEAYYGVLLHELTHWTGTMHRLDREKGKRFGDKAYAFEELVAELGAAFLCSAFNVVNEPRPDHAAYINSWLKILDHDSCAIFAAASLAQKAIEYLRMLAADPLAK